MLPSNVVPHPQAISAATPKKRCGTVQAYLETWLAISKVQFDESPPEHVIQAFRRYLECGRN